VGKGFKLTLSFTQSAVLFHQWITHPPTLLFAMLLLHFSRIHALVLFSLLSLTALAHPTESPYFGRHNFSLNLIPGIRWEVQLFYERAIGLVTSLEVVVGTRVPSGQRDYDTAAGIFIWSPYEDRYYALPYEKGWAAGVNWKKYTFSNSTRRFVPFASAGLLYRFGYFNDRCYAEAACTNSAEWAQAFSLRKHEVSARLIGGIRQRFLLNEQGSLLSLELSSGVGYGVRFGTAFIDRREAGTYACKHLGGNGFSFTQTN
jgi:hypothetical protein